MKVIYSTDETYSFAPCAATVGIFDGVHAGHRFLIDELKLMARERHLESAVITFAEHPRTVLNAEFKPLILDTLSEKIAHIESTGVDTCIVMVFTPEIAKLSAAEFISAILYQKFNVKTLLVGHDHRFGHNRTDGFEEYKQCGNSTGMEVFQALRYKTEIDAEISSSEIRKNLQKGDIVTANRLLHYPYSLTGKVVEGFRVGRTIGFPTANIEPNHSDKIIPAIGVYEVRVTLNDCHYLGMLNIGNRPTLNNGEKISIEVHILNFDEDIYQQAITVSFIRKIRDQRKFNGLDELIAQLQKDKQAVLENSNSNL